MSNNALKVQPTVGRLPVAVKIMPSFMIEKLQELQELKEVHTRINGRLLKYQVISTYTRNHAITDISNDRSQSINIRIY